MSEYILEVRDLKQHFPVRTGWFGTTPLKAVDGVSFGIRPANPAAAKPPWAAPFCTFTSPPPAR